MLFDYGQGSGYSSLHYDGLSGLLCGSYFRLFAKLCGYATPEKFSLCLGVLVVRPKHTDFTTKEQRHKDGKEIVSPGLPTENSEEPYFLCAQAKSGGDLIEERSLRFTDRYALLFCCLCHLLSYPQHPLFIGDSLCGRNLGESVCR